jgi:hypothetical protein
VLRSRSAQGRSCVGTPARARRVDQAAPPSGTARTRPRGPKADPATWEGEPQVATSGGLIHEYSIAA